MLTAEDFVDFHRLVDAGVITRLEYDTFMEKFRSDPRYADVSLHDAVADALKETNRPFDDADLLYR